MFLFILNVFNLQPKLNVYEINLCTSPLLNFVQLWAELQKRITLL